MRQSRARAAAAALLALVLLGCDKAPKSAALPPPQEPTAESIAHFCNMGVLEHSGPKGQIFLPGKPEPIWFASVRDVFAFTMLPEEPKNLAAIYVNDMGETSGDGHAPRDSWIEARRAWFVAGSDYRGGMGASEIVPFSDQAAAARFLAAHGGRLLRFDAVNAREILGYELGEKEGAEPPSADRREAGNGDD